MLQDKTIITQSSTMQKGLSPIGGETFLWTAAMVVKEVILICPDSMEPEEFAAYFGALDAYLVCKQRFYSGWILTGMGL